MAKTATLERPFTNYHASIEVSQSKLKVEKPITNKDGSPDIRIFFVPLTKATVALRNERGGYVVYYMTKMGKKTTFSRTLGLPATKVINKEATGPEFITRGGSTPMKAEQVMATVSRMLGISTVEAATLFDAEGILADHTEEVEA